ncbi:hypothetical protein CLV42_10495 [Chitinophaga ginsengisoli]|uniref:Uncharacterized protein n=1 Tax=Chitinophaga ginsengisoli TaxID=363837 RepID=A0A2P8GCV4_9BACT|nr:hypothetical protein CLV42_10495 [Chitinophaga ginsengisoli]
MGFTLNKTRDLQTSTKSFEKKFKKSTANVWAGINGGIH